MYMLLNDSVCTYFPSSSIFNDFIHENLTLIHYSDVIVDTIASQISSLMIVYSTVYPGADQRKHKAPRHGPLCGEFTGDRWIPRNKGQ